jgi:hypothetical protein
MQLNQHIQMIFPFAHINFFNKSVANNAGDVIRMPQG